MLSGVRLKHTDSPTGRPGASASFLGSWVIGNDTHGRGSTPVPRETSGEAGRPMAQGEASHLSKEGRTNSYLVRLSPCCQVP